MHIHQIGLNIKNDVEAYAYLSTNKSTSKMMLEPKPARSRAEPLVLERLREVVASLGTNKVAAEKTGIPYATLQRMVAGKSPLDHDRLSAIAEKANVTVDYILRRTDAQAPLIRIDPKSLRKRESISDSIPIPRLKAVASAGNGVIADRETLGASPFHFAEDWLRNKFGSVSSLRAVLVNGASQVPDLDDGDWVLIDEAKNAWENGLAVVRLDDGLLVKRIQREDHMLHLLSRNPEYGPITIDLHQEEHRVSVIGKVVYQMRSSH